MANTKRILEQVQRGEVGRSWKSQLEEKHEAPIRNN